MVVVMVVVILHAGKYPDVRPQGVEEGLPPAAFWPLRRNVGVYGRESVLPFINIIVTKPHRTIVAQPLAIASGNEV